MHFNEVFLDNVVVPRENLLGEMNEGWRIMMSALEHERSYDPSYMRALRRLEELVRIAAEKPWNGRRLIDKPDVRLALADMAVAIQASRLLCYRVWWMRQEGIPLTYEASALHVFNVERARHFEAAIAVLGKDLQVDPGDPSAPLFGDIASAWRWGRCRVGAGTPEVNKQVIARRGLGLPR
jgi:alkylation response protein AidB-like acyl-CoA dehydrogenase